MDVTSPQPGRWNVYISYDESVIEVYAAGYTPLYLTSHSNAPDTGKHTVKVVKTGQHKNSYLPYIETVYIQHGSSEIVKAAPQKLSGYLSVSSNVKNTTYSIKDSQTGQIVKRSTYINKLELLTCRYKIITSNDNYLTKSQDINITSNEYKEINIKFSESDKKAYLEHKEQANDRFLKKVYLDAKGDYSLNESVLGLFSSDNIYASAPLLFCYSDELSFFRLPGLLKISFMNLDDHLASSYGFSALGNVNLIADHEVEGWFDIPSPNLGYHLFSTNFRARLHIEAEFGIKLAWTDYQKVYQYNDQEIEFGYLHFSDSDGVREFRSVSQWAPLDAFLAYEHHL